MYAQMVERSVSERRVAGEGFHSKTGNASLCPLSLFLIEVQQFTRCGGSEVVLH